MWAALRSARLISILLSTPLRVVLHGVRQMATSSGSPSIELEPPLCRFESTQSYLPIITTTTAAPNEALVL